MDDEDWYFLSSFDYLILPIHNNRYVFLLGKNNNSQFILLIHLRKNDLDPILNHHVLRLFSQ